MTSSQSPLLLAARIDHWPIDGAFTISRGAKTEAITVVAEVAQGGHTGRGECVPYARYGETPEATLAALLSMRKALSKGLGRQALQAALPAGAVRNDWTDSFLSAPSIRIAGGSDEVQRNILGERVLGLPGDVRVDREVPWSKVPRN